MSRPCSLKGSLEALESTVHCLLTRKPVITFYLLQTPSLLAIFSSSLLARLKPMTSTFKVKPTNIEPSKKVMWYVEPRLMYVLLQRPDVSTTTHKLEIPQCKDQTLHSVVSSNKLVQLVRFEVKRTNLAYH